MWLDCHGDLRTIEPPPPSPPPWKMPNWSQEHRLCFASTRTHDAGQAWLLLLHLCTHMTSTRYIYTIKHPKKRINKNFKHNNTCCPNQRADIRVKHLLLACLGYIVHFLFKSICTMNIMASIQLACMAKMAKEHFTFYYITNPIRSIYMTSAFPQKSLCMQSWITATCWRQTQFVKSYHTLSDHHFTWCATSSLYLSINQ